MKFLFDTIYRCLVPLMIFTAYLALYYEAPVGVPIMITITMLTIISGGLSIEE